MALIYCFAEDWDALKIPAGVTMLVGLAACAAGCVLLALTLQVMVQATGGTGTSNFCYSTFCRLDWFTAVCVVLLGVGFFLGLGTAISVFLTS